MSYTHPIIYHLIYHVTNQELPVPVYAPMAIVLVSRRPLLDLCAQTLQHLHEIAIQVCGWLTNARSNICCELINILPQNDIYIPLLLYNDEFQSMCIRPHQEPTPQPQAPASSSKGVRDFSRVELAISRFMSNVRMPARPPTGSEAGLHLSVELGWTPDKSRAPADCEDERPALTLAIQRACTHHLPALGFSLVPLFRMLDHTNVATVVGAALTGQKILFVSRDVASLTQTVGLRIFFCSVFVYLVLYCICVFAFTLYCAFVLVEVSMRMSRGWLRFLALNSNYDQKQKISSKQF